MYNEHYENPELPSRQTELLRRLRGRVIGKMERFAYFSPTCEEHTKLWQTPPEQYFSRCGGPMLLTLDGGMEVSIGSDPELMSVLIGIDTAETGVVVVRSHFRDDTELHYVNVLDPIYSNDTMRAFVGKRIQTFRLLRIAADYASYEDRPREAGLVVVFQDGAELLLSHGLHDCTDDFSVITPDMIHPKLVSKLTEIPLDL